MRRWVAGALVGSFGLLLGAGGGCGSAGTSSPPDACSAGDERCACYPNSTCNARLSCLSNLCVRQTGPTDGAVDRVSGTGGTGVGGGTGTGGTGTGGSANGGAGGAGTGGSGGRGTGAGGAGGGGIGGSGSAGAGAGGAGKGGAGGIGGAAGGAGKGGAAGGAGKGGAAGGAGKGGAGGGGGNGGAAGAGSGGIGAGGTSTGGAGAGGMGAGGAGGDPGCALVQCPASVPNCCKDWFAFVYDQGTGLSRPDLVTYFTDTSSFVEATFNFENANQFGAIGFDLTQEIDIYEMAVVEGLSPALLSLPNLSFETPTGDGSCMYSIERQDGTYFLTTSPVFYPCNNFSPGRAFKINFLVQPMYFQVQPGAGFGGVSVHSVAMIPF
jgi:hypothetical protein